VPAGSGRVSHAGLRLDDALPAERSERAWIESARFDLAFFVLSPIAGIAVVLADPAFGPSVAILAATLIGGPHYLASFTFYFWPDAAESRRRQWIVYFVAPALIVAFVAAVSLLRIPAVLVLIIYFWNAYHVAKQSCGLLAVYRHRAGCAGERHRNAANAAIISTSLCMALWNTEWYPALHKLLALPSPAAPALLWQLSAVAAVACLAALASSLFSRYREGQGPGAAELAFLATSLTLFHPYLWVRDANLATLGMLMGHFIQYLGIVWLVNRRRFARADAQPRIAAAVWRDWRLVFGIFALCGMLFLLLQLNVMAVTVALVLVHFYLDGVFWAFRRPEVRKSLGPYLTGWQLGHDKS